MSSQGLSSTTGPSKRADVRTIGVVTCGRSDVGFLVPLMRAIASQAHLELEVVATGMHLSQEFGFAAQHIEAAGFPIHHRVESLLASDTPEGIGKSIGVGTMGFAQLFARWRPDILVVHGDRFDTLPAALAALPHRIPVAHLAGGDVTEGAMDDAIRHSLTKLSHLHFVELESLGQRVQQMGEEPWRVTVSGALSLDTIRQTELMKAPELQHTFGLSAGTRVLLVTLHPATLAAHETGRHIAELLAALEATGLPCVFTYPNADTESRQIIEAIHAFCDRHPACRVVVNAGQRGYLSLMAQAGAMVGNSSSGIVEAASFRLPVVNVGDRQRGRLHPANVIDVEADRRAIHDAIRDAMSERFRERLRDLVNPYGDGHAAERIVARLADVELSERLIHKRFYEPDRSKPLMSVAVET